MIVLEFLSSFVSVGGGVLLTVLTVVGSGCVGWAGSTTLSVDAAGGGPWVRPGLLLLLSIVLLLGVVVSPFPLMA